MARHHHVTTSLPKPHVTIPLLKRFWLFMRPYRRMIVFIGLLMALGLPASVLPPLLVKHLVDSIMPGGALPQLLTTGAALIGLVLVSQIIGYFQGLLSSRFHLLVLYRMRRHLFAHLLRLPVGYYVNQDTGYMMSRQRDDLRNLGGMMADTFLRAGLNVIRAVVFIGMLFFLDAVLAMSGLVLVVVFFGANLLFSRPLRKRNEAVQETEAKTSTALHEGIIGANLIKATVREKAEGRRYVRALTDYVRVSIRRDILELFSEELIGGAALIGGYCIILIGAYRIMLGDSTFGNLFAFFMYLTNLFAVTGALMRLNSTLQRAMASLQRIYEVLDTPAESIIVAPKTTLLPRCEIVFEDVSFSYIEGKPVLQNISARIPAGAQVALVGPSGAGKTTFAHLVPRFYQPNSGHILLNDIDIATMPLYELRRQIGIVPQDVFLFDRTIQENVAYGNHIADPAMIEEAARAANAHDFILELPNGYDTKIGERGVRLSGGQKQRIALAREILRNPPILILDEATSSLDSASEALIQEAIKRFKVNRTAIIIAHRLSTVIEADLILVFEHGKIVEQGTHEKLLAAGGFYAFLFEMQFKRGLMVVDEAVNELNN